MAKAIGILSGPRRRLLFAIAVGLIAAALPFGRSPAVRGLAAWSVGVGVYLAMVLVVMLRADADDTRRRATREDPGRSAVDFVLTVASLASLVAVFYALHETTLAKSAATAFVMAVAVVAATLSWLLTHVLYAVHYARMYYADEDGEPRGGMDFHCDDAPDYRDFLYFSVGVACTFGATDVQLTGRHFRRAVTGHALLSFAYATINLTLAVNVVTDALSKS